MKKTIGGDRLGAGKKMKVDLHGYERSTHDMGYLWRSTMAAGTLVPFLVEPALPGDTFDINLDCDMKTHPTIGPLFGSYKVQLDVFQAPMRLYQGQLHNNKLGIGMNMANVKLPLLKLYAEPGVWDDATDKDNFQINPSCILSYLGIRGVGVPNRDSTTNVERAFNGIPYLAYWDIYKNYYANKQEEFGWVIHKESATNVETIDDIIVNGSNLPVVPGSTVINVIIGSALQIQYTGATPILNQILLNTSVGLVPISSVLVNRIDTAGQIDGTWGNIGGTQTVYSWQYDSAGSVPSQSPVAFPFVLEDIDRMREAILADVANVAAFDITTVSSSAGEDIQPYKFLLEWVNNKNPYVNTQEGLGLKTYQSDLFNNWMDTDWIDGTGGINEITAISTVGNTFNIDTLVLSKKVYDMLNRIAISGGSYDDWLDAVYTHDRYTRAETPIYHGGLIKELVFQEVISNSESAGEGTQPLGTLGGRGVLGQKHKGGSVTIKVDEPSYIIGIISLTPRIDYSQGNKWDTGLFTMDDLHKPALDEIGFQDLITEQMAWWDTNEVVADTGEWTQKSAGKQPAWINYMTNVNQTRGNFAIRDNEMFMTLNRRYEPEPNQNDGNILDLTTYIDPVKYNNSFAETSIDAQNFWAQIAVDITARRKMSAKIMPNL